MRALSLYILATGSDADVRGDARAQSDGRIPFLTSPGEGATVTEPAGKRAMDLGIFMEFQIRPENQVSGFDGGRRPALEPPR